MENDGKSNWIPPADFRSLLSSQPRGASQQEMNLQQSMNELKQRHGRQDGRRVASYYGHDVVTQPVEVERPPRDSTIYPNVKCQMTSLQQALNDINQKKQNPTAGSSNVCHSKTEMTKQLEKQKQPQRSFVKKPSAVESKAKTRKPTIATKPTSNLETTGRTRSIHNLSSIDSSSQLGNQLSSLNRSPSLTQLYQNPHENMSPSGTGTMSAAQMKKFLGCTDEEYKEALELIQKKSGYLSAPVKKNDKVNLSTSSSSRTQKEAPVLSLGSLNCLGDFRRSEISSKMHSTLKKYVETSIGSKYAWNIGEIKSVAEEIRTKYTNAMLLWYKTTESSLKLLNSEGTPLADYRLVFYDRIKPALNLEASRQIIFLCLVDLGTMTKSPEGITLWSKQWFPKCFDSVKALGRKIPDEDADHDWKSVIVPCGVTKTPRKLRNSALKYNEYIINDRNRAKIVFAMDLELTPIAS